MPGQYTVAMLGLKYGRSNEDVRNALWDSGIATDVNDMVDVDVVEKDDSKIKKHLADSEKARMDAKAERANAGEAKEKFIKAHNAKLAPASTEED